jgi:hypothetical protein
MLPKIALVHQICPSKDTISKCDQIAWSSLEEGSTYRESVEASMQALNESAVI